VIGESDVPPTLDQQAAVAHTKEALRLVKAGKIEEGCELFSKAMQLWPHVSNAVNVARCHERFGRVASAWGSYYRALTLNEQTADPAERAERQRRVKAAIARLEPRLPRVKLSLATGDPPEGFVVHHAGKDYPADVLGQTLPIDPGDGVIYAEAPGYLRDAQMVTFEEGKTATVTFSLRPVPKRRPKPTMVEVRTTPTWVWATAGVAVASAAASIAFFVDMSDAIDDVNAACPSRDACPNATEVPIDDEDRANRGLGFGVAFGVASVGLVSATLVGVIVGEVELVPEQAWRVVPWVDRQSGGVGVVGAF
jgi:hypothetical protein